MAKENTASITIIILEPEHSSNVGAFCRVMKNFDFTELVIINAKCEKDLDAVKRAKHAIDVLKKAKFVKKTFKDAIKGFDLVVGTTAKLGSDYNIPRSPINAEQLAEKLKDVSGKIALVFGREGEGLHNDEIELCDFVVTISTSKTYPTMNLSHAAAVIFYEIFKTTKKPKVASHIALANEQEKKILFGLVNDVLEKMDFSTEEKRTTQKQLWQKVIGKSLLTKREMSTMCGFIRKIR
ncbi:MAG: RNA methyltransferase [Nanoarchaeota archaeon]|nr:RNA methyltransferase [Nanoarchaeota archaeon]